MKIKRKVKSSQKPVNATIGKTKVNETKEVFSIRPSCGDLSKDDFDLSTTILKEIQDRSDELISKAEDFSVWAYNVSTNDFGSCNSIYKSYEFTFSFVCDIIDKLNAFWFALGMCVVLLPFNIVFGVKLAKFFRRMEIEDDYEDILETEPLTSTKEHVGYHSSQHTSAANESSYAHTQTEDGSSYYSEVY